jgi:pilus assembly protein CpaE
MATDILIVWPRAEEAGRLQDAMLRSSLRIRPRMLEDYPDRTRLAEIAADPGAVRAFVVGMHDQERALRALEDIHTECPGMPAIAAHGVASADLLRAVMRTGAADFLTPPFQVADIERCFGGIAAQAADGPGGALIAIAPCQGNDGASTVALHLAQGLSKAAGTPALLIDCDVQCGVAAFRLGLCPLYTLADALAHSDQLDEFLPKIVIRSSDFDLVAAPDSPVGLMGDHLQRLPQAFSAARRNYANVIADMPPGLFAAGLDVLLEADRVLLVCTPEITSLHLARRRVSELLDSGVDKARLGIVVNRADSRGAIPSREIERAVGMPVLHALANDYDAVTKAAVAGALVAADSRLGKDLRALTTRIAGPQASQGPAKAPAAPSWRRMLTFG